ncbi:MAG: type II secretion system protein [Chthoniobacter sp.]|nr:type II secretion system protein [Chthoniobacter sp.]
MKKKLNLKGFTLIELLVVIAIIAILAVVVVLTLNPAQLLAQSRDSNRVSDMATLKSAMALYQADVATSTFGTANKLYEAYVTAGIGVGVTTTGATWWGYNTGDVTAWNASTSRAVDGTGWIPIPFSTISSGAPLGSLPVDPLGVAAANTNCSAITGVAPCAYTFLSNSTGTYKMATKMESTKYNYLQAGDVVSTDGGNSTTTYEAGTNVNL